MTEIEAAIFFGLAVLPWALSVPIKFKLPLLGLILLSPYVYWLTQSVESWGILALILIIPGWAAGVELLLVDYLNFSVVDLLNIKRCPCQGDFSWWRPVLWISLAGLIAAPSPALSESTTKRH